MNLKHSIALKNTIESINEANTCSLSVLSGDRLNSTESNETYYSKRCQSLENKLRESQTQLINGQKSIDILNDELFDVNDKNIQLMNDIGRLKKRFI